MLIERGVRTVDMSLLGNGLCLLHVRSEDRLRLVRGGILGASCVCHLINGAKYDAQAISTALTESAKLISHGDELPRLPFPECRALFGS